MICQTGVLFGGYLVFQQELHIQLTTVPFMPEKELFELCQYFY